MPAADAPDRRDGHVWLIGMMGAGKTATGRLLAERLARPFVDLDERVEEEAGCSIAELFASEGEAGFRMREAVVLAMLAVSPERAVVATGGGSPCFGDALALMERSGLVVWLRVEADEVFERLDAAQRPLLHGGDPRERWRALEEQRRPTYARAALTVDRRGRRPEDVAGEIARHLDGPEKPLARLPDLPFTIVELGERRYPVYLDAGEGAEGRFAQVVAARFPRERTSFAVVTDVRVARLHLRRYLGALRDRGVRVFEVVVPEGERSKSLGEVERVAGALVAGGLDRDGVVAALGGGVVGDLAGFAAAVLFRGVELIQLPTTLMAMVDSSVGGKTGVDLAAGKNLVGAFHQPALVWADLPLLRTLSARDLSAGLGEVVKHALLDGEEALAALEAAAAAALAADPATLAALVASSVRLKARIVARDERERDRTGGRTLLNLGHTVGHALEAESLATVDPLRHGEAVALGLLAAARVGAALQPGPGGASAPPRFDLEERLAALLPRLGLPADLDGALARLPHFLARVVVDKKRSGEELRYVALAAPGRPEVVPLAPSRLAALLKRTRSPATGSTPEATP